MIEQKDESSLKALFPLALFLVLVVYLLLSDTNTVGPF